MNNSVSNSLESDGYFDLILIEWLGNVVLSVLITQSGNSVHNTSENINVFLSITTE